MSRRRWRVAGAVLLVLTAGAVAYAATRATAPHSRVAEVLRAQKFEVVDAKGRVSAELQTRPGGFVEVGVNDRRGDSRASLHLSQGAFPRFAVTDRPGAIRGLIGITTEDFSLLGIQDENEKPLLGIMASDARSGLEIYGSGEVARVTLEVEADGFLTASATTPDDRGGASFHLSTEEIPFLMVARNGKVIWKSL